MEITTRAELSAQLRPFQLSNSVRPRCPSATEIRMSSETPANQRAGVTVVPHEGTIEQTLFIISRQGSSEAVNKVVQAIKTVGAQTLTN